MVCFVSFISQLKSNGNCFHLKVLAMVTSYMYSPPTVRTEKRCSWERLSGYSHTGIIRQVPFQNMKWKHCVFTGQKIVLFSINKSPRQEDLIFSFYILSFSSSKLPENNWKDTSTFFHSTLSCIALLKCRNYRRTSFRFSELLFCWCKHTFSFPYSSRYSLSIFSIHSI